MTYSVCCDILVDVFDILFRAVSILFFRHAFASVLIYTFDCLLTDSYYVEILLINV